MKALSDILEEKRQELNLKGVTARSLTENEVDWIKTKQYVDQLPTFYQEVFLELKEKNPSSVSKVKFGKNIIMKVDEIVFDHAIRIEIIEDENKIVKSIKYYAYNRIPPLVYIRKIV